MPIYDLCILPGSRIYRMTLSGGHFIKDGSGSVFEAIGLTSCKVLEVWVPCPCLPYGRQGRTTLFDVLVALVIRFQSH